MGKWEDGRGTLWVPARPAAANGIGVPDGVGVPVPDGVGVPDGFEVPVPDGFEVPVPDGVGVPLEVAASYRSRRRGLLGRDGVAGALLIVRTNSVHTFGMRFAIDVAHLDRSFTVLSVVTMPPGRLGMIRPRGRHVLEAEAGAMAGWGLRPGARVRLDVTAGPNRAG